MKKAKKVVALALCAVMLVVGSVAGTLAYLQDTAEVTNTFTVGKVDIKLDETKVDTAGKTTNEGRIESGNTYKLMPGHTYTKDPMVTVLPNSEESFIRMIVTINDLADLKAACNVTGAFYPQNFVTGWDSTKWACVSMNETNDNKGIYEFRYYKTVSTGTDAQPLEALFTGFTMPGTATNAQIAALEGMKIDVVAQAIQKDTFADANAAWAAFQAPVVNN